MHREPQSAGIRELAPKHAPEELLNTFESLPEYLRAWFRGPCVRIFNYAFENVSGSKSCVAELPAIQLERIWKPGLSLMVTIYQNHEQPGKVDA